MDYVSHGFWSYIFFNKIKRPLFAIFFGLLPDTMSWGVYAVYRLVTGGKFGKPILSEMPDWAFTLYNISHSLIVAGTIILLIFILLRRVPIYIFAWPIAITLDILTHTKDYLPTPFLWPISKWSLNGISWGTWQFMVINYSLIVLLLIIIFYRKRKS